ncbi:MAG: hypothetical protein MUF64_27945 [Polyangiaceae bacterium]|jgi:hypothetical protein|nr:hypothetical protein [Polyangiaceae bacterium]
MLLPSIAPPTPGASRRVALVWLTLGASLASPGLSHAQPSGAEPVVIAEGLFQDAKRLLNEGNPGEACPKLVESHRLDPAGGTALLLGSCYERLKRWASAWGAYREALGFAIKDHREDRELRARERIEALEPRLGRLQLQVPAALQQDPGVWIRVGSQQLARAAWSSLLPLDPGEHLVSAGLAGGCSWSILVPIPEHGGVSVLPVPSRLDCDKQAPPTTPKGSPPRAAYGMFAAGTIALGTGAVLGLQALHKDREADRRCPQTRCTDRSAVELSSEARRLARASNVGFVLGATALSAGLLLLLLHPSQRSTPIQVNADLGPTGGHLVATGVF